MGSGLTSQFGFAAETTAGTFTTPTRFLEYTGETLRFQNPRIESNGLRNRRIQSRWAQGVQWVDGDVNLELAPQGTGLLFKHAFGSVSTTGSSTYSHTFTPGSLDGLYMTLQINKPTVSGNQAFTYLGCQMTGFEIAAAINEYVTMRTSWYGQDESLSESLASASYPSGFSPFTFVHGTLTVGGTAVDVRSVNLQADNALLTGRHFMRSTTPKVPKKSLEGGGFRQYTGSLVAEFESTTQYALYKAGTESSLVLSFVQTAGSASLVITMNTRYDGETPVVTGPDLLEQTLPYKVIGGATDAAAITAVLINSDSTP